VYPFEAQRAIGSVIEVSPSTAKVNLPGAASPEGQWLHGQYVGAGEVGEFVVIECGEYAVFGRIVGVKLPEHERLTVEPELGAVREAHPVGTVQLLTTVALRDGKVTGGIAEYPRLGSRAYSAHPSLVQWIAESVQRSAGQARPVVMNLATLPHADDTTVGITPERIFGKHCAVLGSTGGGKSWTLARLIEQAATHNAKLILFDASGEFYTLTDHVQHVHIGEGAVEPAGSVEVVVPYSELTEADLFAMFTPSGQTQAPKLRAAMKSLKLMKLDPSLATNGVMLKAGKSRIPFENAYAKHAGVLETARADFDISCLTKQIDAECVWPTDRNNPANWGGVLENERSYCVSLITRIEDMLGSKHLACVFKTGAKTSLSATSGKFLENENDRVLRISLKYLPFDHNARPIVANAIGRYLLAQAREGRFLKQPVVVFLDEAHQFLNRSLGDEYNRYPLDSYELIAKEGRKFSLNICLSTQRPRDIPEGVLSQMGTLIVHRLINDKDREVVERASGDIDRSAAAFLPTLAPGEAVIIGVDFPVPLTIQVSRPQREPVSAGPDYQTCWGCQQEQANG
jgi:energy-coupling factor transporter ATP-binding protein EcfA2